MYKRFGKRAIDLLLSGLGLIILSPLFLIISVAIKAEDPGPVFFKQKRVGIHKSYFNIVKFRSMRQDTPHDMPTHMLNNPQQWITKTGRFLRKGKMSIIGPRPALWNQYDLIAERDKYGANDVTPGLTGWAQVNGRDELEIEEKARLDGEYAQKLSFAMDAKIFFMTFFKVARGSGVVEGGPKEMRKGTER